MRPRDPRTNLTDVVAAGELIAQIVEDLTFDGFCADRVRSSAVERQLEIVGEALNRALSADPSLEHAIPDVRRAIGLRNILAHGYDRASDALVFSAATESLPRLLADVRALLSASS